MSRFSVMAQDMDEMSYKLNSGRTVDYGLVRLLWSIRCLHNPKYENNGSKGDYSLNKV